MDFYEPRRGLMITSINSVIAREVYDGFYFAGEMHDFWEMVYCRSGSCFVSEDGRVYEISNGQAVFHKPMEFHRLWARRGETAQLIIISFSCAESRFIDVLGNGVFSLDTVLCHELCEVFEQLCSTFDCSVYPVGKADSSAAAEMSVLLRTELIFLAIVTEINPGHTQLRSIGAQNYKRILNVMKTRIDENLSVEEIAEQCFLSTSNLKKTFRRYAGCGVKEHYNKLRMIRAAELLKRGMRVSDVSGKMNFSSSNYFSGSFKREFGVSPAQYVAKSVWNRDK